MAKEKCILCGAETPYDETTPIDSRSNYIEGAGQLCYECAHRFFSFEQESPKLPEVEKFIRVPYSKILELSNNFELGEYVRNKYNAL